MPQKPKQSEKCGEKNDETRYEAVILTLDART